MTKEYTSLGLMSGTSGDGVDASIIKSDGLSKYKVKLNRYFEYDKDIYQNIHFLKAKVKTSKDLKKYSSELKNLERIITMFHIKLTSEILKSNEIDLIGFHGQTIYHNAREKISRQLGDGNLFSKLIGKTVIFNFRQNDIKNGGEGAPLAPVFHKLIVNQNKIHVPVCILNIGGIANISIINNYETDDFNSRDIGPGNCLIDTWIRNNSNQKFDTDGKLASLGKINEIILEQAQELYSNRPNKKTFSLDVNDFDVSFARGLSLEDGAATLTDFTSRIIYAEILNSLTNFKKNFFKILVSGGGRKNKTLLNFIKNKALKNLTFETIDSIGIDGDFVESQAFAYLAIRSFIKQPISFPNTTGCKSPSVGGEIVKPT